MNAFQTILLALLTTIGATLISALIIWLLRPKIKIRITSSQPATIAPGKPAEVEVDFGRWRYNGELTVRIDGLPTGLVAEPVEIPLGADQGRITLVAKAGSLPRSNAKVHVVAGAQSVFARAPLQISLLTDPPPPPPPPPPSELKGAFDQFRANRRQYATVLLRRMRVKQLGDLLATPETIDLGKFNREVWLVVRSMFVDSKSVTPWPKGKQDQVVDDAMLPAFEEALEAGRVKFVGNSIWGSGSKEYAPMLKMPDQEKTENIRRALRILNDPNRLPLQKAHAIDDVPGFGENTATGLVMVYHHTEFAIYNQKSQKALRMLGYAFRDLESFEKAVEGLRELVGAEDFLELDWFLYLVGEGYIRAPQAREAAQ